MKPLVSVIIPTFNRAATLPRAIDSVLAQSYQPIELIVVDDGSSDGTGAVLGGYGKRIKTLYQENGGPSAARNAGVAMASGELVGFLDSDDVWLPDKLERQVRLLVAGGRRVACCICNARVIDDGASMATTFEVSDVMTDVGEGYWMNPAPVLATRFVLFNQVAVLRRQALIQVGGFKTEMRLLEDYDLAFRIALLGPWAFVAEPLVEKYNNTGGIGVAAMHDPLVHAQAWQRVLAGFLKTTARHDPEVAPLIRRALADVKREIHAVTMQRSNGSMHRLVARLWMGLQRGHHALRRRLPGWPRVVATPVLPRI